MLRKIRNILPGTTADGIMISSNWTEERSGIRWTLERETDEGIQLKKKKTKLMKNMETGEEQLIYRVDVSAEWFKYNNRMEWPEYAKIAEKEGGVWNSDLQEPGMGLWGALVTHGSKWRKEK